MSPEAQRIAIAEACGWSVRLMSSVTGACEVVCPDGCVETSFWMPNRAHTTSAPPLAERFYDLPDYLEDLNAMHEAEGQALNGDQYDTWVYVLAEIGMRDGETGSRSIAVGRATAAQRAEAFLRTLGKWEDSK